jgi:serine phosphatase RsbU (regulator of sigma subunit)
VPPALPLGLIAEAEFEKATASLGIGDRLMLYTDGLLEARNAAGELFGFTRVAELVAGKPDAREAAESGIRFGQDDDITVVTATRLAPRVEATTVVTSSVELRFV